MPKMQDKGFNGETSFDYRATESDGHKMSMILTETMNKSRLNTSKLSKKQMSMQIIKEAGLDQELNSANQTKLSFPEQLDQH